MTARPPLAVVPATIGRRVGAYTIDLAIAAGIGIAFAGVAVGIVLGTGSPADPRTLALAFVLAGVAFWAGSAAWAIVCTAMQGGRGSVGQRAVDIRLVRADGSGPIGFWRALGRNVVWALSCMIFVGWFTPLFDASPLRQGWHDRASGAIVIDGRWTDAAAPAAPHPRAVAHRLPQAAPTEVEFSPWFLDAPSVVPPRPAPPVLPNAAVPPTAIIPVVHPVPAPAPPLQPAAAATFAPSAPPAPAPVLVPQLVPAASDLDATRTAITVPPPAQRAALFADPPVLAVLTWDDGSAMAVYGRTLYGRNPAVEPGTVSVPVRDETLSLSKTHFEIGGDASASWVLDRHSTNGTVLVRDGGRHRLIPGIPTSLRSGDRLELGDRSVFVGSTS
ncbi:RDD family protein [Microbacterium sp. CFBP9034]|uniref:RDD family protein n=1 Tax=Microbacterium sp. CFBP9034 TaxID=3096540 RepID=UPI002A6A159A|nr:RDD family protein [Microbacterium sp. CFBP9034]MDY0907943.1 RDD family protein [Microbacterium sp. CFBP9034]